MHALVLTVYYCIYTITAMLKRFRVITNPFRDTDQPDPAGLCCSASCKTASCRHHHQYRYCAIAAGSTSTRAQYSWKVLRTVAHILALYLWYCLATTSGHLLRSCLTEAITRTFDRVSGQGDIRCYPPFLFTFLYGDVEHPAHNSGALSPKNFKW